MILIRRLEHVNGTVLRAILDLTGHWSYITRRQMGRVQFSTQQVRHHKNILMIILGAENDIDR